MDDNELLKIDLEDIQDLVIRKKFVKINSDKYTDSAFQYIKYLIDKERAILFDEDTHRIYTLGDYYGGDALQENLLYFSKLLSIDIDNEILSEINALQNSDTLAIKGKGPLNVNFVNDKYSTIELEYKLNDAINKNPFSINPNNEYSFYIDDDGKISLSEYIYPKINLTLDPLTYNGIGEYTLKEFTYEVITSIDLNDWEKFDISTSGCDLIEHNQDEHKITIKFYNDIDADIVFDYSDGKNSDKVTFTQNWNKIYFYGIYDGENFTEIGNHKFVNDIKSLFKINQLNIYYAYCICPVEYKPIFYDNYTKMQGAWHKLSTKSINGKEYNVYITDNSGLGNIEWYIINKNI